MTTEISVMYGSEKVKDRESKWFPEWAAARNNKNDKNISKNRNKMTILAWLCRFKIIFY